MAEEFVRPEETATSRKEREENLKQIRNLQSINANYQQLANMQKMLLPKLLLQRRLTESQISIKQREIANDEINLKLIQDKLAAAEFEMNFRTELQGKLAQEIAQKEKELQKSEEVLSRQERIQELVKKQLQLKEQELKAIQNNIEAKQTGRNVTESELQKIQQQYAEEINRRIEAGQGVTELEKALGTRITELRGALDMYDAEIQAGQQTVDQLSNATLTLTQAVSNWGKKINETAQQTGSLRSELGKLKNKASANDEKLKQLPNEISGLKNKASTLSEKLVSSASQLKNMKTNAVVQALDMAAEALKKFADGMRKVLDEIYAIAAKLEVQMGTAGRAMIGSRFQSATSAFTRDVIVSQEEVLDATKAFKDEFGTILSSRAAGDLAEASKLLGISANVMVKAERAFLAAGGEITKSKFTSEFVRAGLTASSALKFAANNANLVAIAGEKYSGSLARAAAQAEKIGVALSKTSGFFDGIVDDFEGALERASELRAMGFEYDFNEIARVAGTGTEEERQQALVGMFKQNQSLLEDVQRNAFLRRSIEKDTGFSIAEAIRLAKGEEALPKVETVEEQQLSTLQKILQVLEGTARIGGRTLKGAGAGAAAGLAIGAMGGPIGMLGGALIGGTLGLGAGLLGMADGGLVTGPGTSTSDSVPTRLSNGEFVINAKDTKRIGLSALSALNSGASVASIGMAATEKGALKTFFEKGMPYAFSLGKFGSKGLDLTRQVQTIFGAVGKYSPLVLKELGKNLRVVPVIGSLLGGLITGIQEFKETGSIGRAFGKGTLSSLVGILGSAAFGYFGGPFGAAVGGMAGNLAGENLFDMAFGSVKKADDAEIRPSSGYGKRALLFNDSDTIMAGTKLMSPGTLTPVQTMKQQQPEVNNIVNVNMDKMEAKLDKLAAAFANIKIEMDGNTVGRVTANSRSSIDRLAVVG